jgi:hypothetical protein
MGSLEAKCLLKIIDADVLLDLLWVREVRIVSVQLVLPELEDLIPVTLNDFLLAKTHQVTCWLIKHCECHLVALQYRCRFVLELFQDLEELQALLLDLGLVYVLTELVQHFVVPQYFLHILYKS